MLHPFSQQISDIFPAARLIREERGYQWGAGEKTFFFSSDSAGVSTSSVFWCSSVEASRSSVQMRKKDVLNLARFLSFTQKCCVSFGVSSMHECGAKKAKSNVACGDFLKTVNNTTMFKNVTQCLQNKCIILWMKSPPSAQILLKNFLGHKITQQTQRKVTRNI